MPGDEANVWAAVFSGVSAWFAYQSAKTMQDALRNDIEQRRQEAMPLLSLSQVKVCEEPDPANIEKYGRYRINLHFANLGKGPAHLNVVELDDLELTAHISTPLACGPTGYVTVTLWVRDIDTRYSLRMGIYYWDVNDLRRGTQISFRIRPHLTNGEYRSGLEMFAEWTIEPDHEKRPSRVMHWDGDNRKRHENWIVKTPDELESEGLRRCEG